MSEYFPFGCCMCIYVYRVVIKCTYLAVFFRFILCLHCIVLGPLIFLISRILKLMYYIVRTTVLFVLRNPENKGEWLVRSQKDFCRSTND